MNWQGDIFLAGQTTCGHKRCNKVIPLNEAIVKCMHIGEGTIQEHFCSEKCHHDWYLNRLNVLGM